MKRWSALWAPMLFLLTAFGCGGGGGTPFTPPDRVPVTIPPEPDLSQLPLNAEGHPVVVQTDQVEISIDTSQRGPTNALAACMAVIEQCWVDQRRSAVNRIEIMDRCERSAPTCATDEPWNETACCPAACWQRYEAARFAGQDPTAIEDEIYFGSDPCIPGLGAAVGGTP